MIRLPFEDREDAGRELAKALDRYAGTHPLVLAIPRGGVPIGRIVADTLQGELDVALVRKLGAPGNPEFAIGAVDEQGTAMLNEGIARYRIDPAYVQQEANRQLGVIRERRARYAPEHSAISPLDRTVIVVDDGLATGATMAAALKAVRAQHPQRLICAVPVAARGSLASVARYADEMVCLSTPDPLISVGRFYRQFSSVSDDEVIRLLRRNSADASPSVVPVSSTVRIRLGLVVVEGDLTLPASAQALVLFAHGSGSSRHSPRNRFVATALNRLGFATLLFDLLTPAEDRDPAARFDIALLASRLEGALDWVLLQPKLRSLPVGLFGASTGAAAALRVAADRPSQVHAVVSRGGRPDMAGVQALTRVQTPTLLIVGGEDHDVLALNRLAQAKMPGCAEMVVVPGATHLFEEPGTLEKAAEAAGRWFATHLPP